jgi:hypothetical protein
MVVSCSCEQVPLKGQQGNGDEVKHREECRESFKHSVASGLYFFGDSSRNDV